ncbi:MAG: zinc-ribbon domain-containing protein [Eubacteriales bacterium]
MYCVKCGVELADTENVCPLCGTHVYHPDIERAPAEPTYPEYEKVHKNMRPHGLLFIITVLAAMPVAITLFCDLYFGNGLTWSIYPIGGIILFYIAFVLPQWFRRPNPVVFVPVTFGVLGLYLLYINFSVDGHWFLSFAFPILVYVSLCVCTVVTLLRYTRRGRLYIAGASFLAAGVLCPLIEFFMNLTFLDKGLFDFFWSIIPLIACFLAGMMLIVIAIVKPLRESLRKKFFI